MTEPEPPPAETRRAPGPRSVSSAKPLMQILAQKRAAARAEAASNSEENGASATATTPTVIAAASNARLEELAEQILQELQRRHHTSTGDFSITKLLAGIVQIVALAVLLIAFWMFQANLIPVLIVALFLQVFTVALLIMDRQK